jgi:hypothetical protein
VRFANVLFCALVCHFFVFTLVVNISSFSVFLHLAVTVGASVVRDFEIVTFQGCTEPSRRSTTFYFYYQSVKDGLAVVEQSENAGIPRPPALHLHIVTGSVFSFFFIFL